MSTLHERLHELADDGPDGSVSAGSDELWQRGRRLQRRRRAVSVTLVAVLVLGLGSLTTLVVDATAGRSIPAADADAVLGLPDRLYLPSPWTDGTDETGPIGPLVALVGAERRTSWTEETIDVSGVSTSGDYVFLDLESRASGSSFDNGVRLSPGGRWVAYAVTGETDEEPYSGDGDPVVGVAVYDSVTGETLREIVPTDHGLDVQDLVWIGDTLVTPYSQVRSWDEDGGVRLSGQRVHRWSPADGTVEPALARPDVPGFVEATPAGDQVAVTTGRRGYEIVAADGTAEAGPRLSTATEGPVHVSPDGRTVAMRADPDSPSLFSSEPGRLVSAPTAGEQAGVATDVGDVLVSEVAAWRDDDHVVARVADVPGLASVDVTTGEVEPLVELPQAYGMEPQIAADAFAGPVFEAPEPDGPGDPRRIVWLGGGLLVLLAGAALWRSRVRL